MPAGPIFQRLCLATVLSIFILVVLGGVVRVTESGLGCPDWPLCHGKIVPLANAETIIEYSHRMVASVVGVLLLAVTVVAWRRYRDRPMILAPATLALVLVVVQGALGGATVLTDLEGDLVMAHLGMAQALLAVTMLVFLAAWRGIVFSARGWGLLAALAGATAVGAFILLMSGSYVTTSGASWACDDWPLCQGNIFMSSKFPAIHMIHRYVALGVGLLAVATIAVAWRQRGLRPDLAFMGIVSGVLFLSQVLVGAVTVLEGLPAEMRALHLALATLVWGAFAALALLPYTPTEPLVGQAPPDIETLPSLRPATQ